MTIANNPLGIEDKLYTVEEFAFVLRAKFGSNDNLPDSVLVDVFITQYPMYSCKIKKTQSQAAQNSCGCC